MFNVRDNYANGIIKLGTHTWLLHCPQDVIRTGSGGWKMLIRIENWIFLVIRADSQNLSFGDANQQF